MASAADDNVTFLDQDGTNNSASVTQSGNDNEAGASGLAVTQDGFYNQLEILQSGNNNEIGLEGVGVRQEAVLKNGSNPIANTLVITQSSSFNTVGSVYQDSDGTDQQASARNRVNITQAGLGGHRIGTVHQERGASNYNVLNVTQNGLANVLEDVYQRNRAGGNVSNSINVNMSGASNGRNLIGAPTELDLFADIADVQGSTLRQGWVRQFSRRNTIDLDVSGTFNNFGITQDGKGNTVGTVTMTGGFNQLGIRQDGDDNQVSLSTISGIGNNIGVAQYQDNNIAGVNVSGNANRLGVLQDGMSNTADVAITGDNNGLAYNSVSFFGQRIYTSADSLDNPAAGIALLPGFELGRVTQFGDDNDVNLNIDGNNNLFGTLQDGVGNSIEGTVDGNGNQFAVAQVGVANMTNFTQTGGGNNLAVSQ
ncbi:hypothetical protein BOO69_08070 [Sulfitobacter alexandrii]|uniref:Curlin associated repeat-containing protein n=2 Tax=Sulfitobacter alexandrii TaxID=1917485 RepID=A0A1J0WGD4_9RHOB|nr:hypothetical protein BOO69_08070 [Sulfitobacter alexandrii]